MKRIAVVIAVLVSGCAIDDALPLPVEQQAGSCPYMPEHPTFCSAVGSQCDRSATLFCDRGLAWCDETNICRPICSAVTYPRCGDGLITRFEPDGIGSSVCLCVPE